MIHLKLWADDIGLCVCVCVCVGMFMCAVTNGALMSPCRMYVCA